MSTSWRVSTPSYPRPHGPFVVPGDYGRDERFVLGTGCALDFEGGGHEANPGQQDVTARVAGLQPRSSPWPGPSPGPSVLDWENPEVFGRNKEPAHATLVPYPDEATALVGTREASSFFQSLNGELEVPLGAPARRPPRGLLPGRTTT